MNKTKIPFKSRNRLKGINGKFQFCLFLFKGRADCSLAVTGAAALDVHMVGMAFIIGIINTFYRFAVNTDGLAGMRNGAFERIHSLLLLPETLAAGAVAAAGMLPAHHNISFAAQMLFIVGTVFHRTF